MVGKIVWLLEKITKRWFRLLVAPIIRTFPHEICFLVKIEKFHVYKILFVVEISSKMKNKNGEKRNEYKNCGKNIVNKMK